jgi:hypothetical protein|tara:strand:+ start:686 stop:913 length:228 start_codon:yes stop_codon:yes gene_type:complete
MPISNENELKTKVQAIASNKRAYRNSDNQASIASMIKTEITDLETAGSDAALISTCKKYLKRVENHYSESVNNLT